jgi:predicted nucleic acid-binding protein
LNEPTKGALLELTREADLQAPPTLPWEVGNALSALFKRRRIDLTQARQALASFSSIPIRLAEIDLDVCVELADREGMYAYDAYVLECARRYRTPLLSLDRPLCERATHLGIPVLEI